MRRFSLTLVLLAAVLWIGSAQAGSPLSPERIARIAKISVIVSTINITYSGTGCMGADPDCFQVNSHGTRSGPTVPADCAVTPVRRSTWGEVKTIYR